MSCKQFSLQTHAAAFRLKSKCFMLFFLLVQTGKAVLSQNIKSGKNKSLSVDKDGQYEPPPPKKKG